MNLETIGRLREEIIKERKTANIELRSVQDKDDKILFTARQYTPPPIDVSPAPVDLFGVADKTGKLLKLDAYEPPAVLPISKPEKVERVKQILESCGYKFEHPTLVLEGRDSWFVILTPHRSPFQAIVHWDGKQADFFATVPELIE